ncbi:MAG TPA: hypothetical protein VEK55_11135, partial [Xanthobacteraceae bacterium]|nr:hypothetical protein [Xanthobacteraceae bacterium]
ETIDYAVAADRCTLAKNLRKVRVQIAGIDAIWEPPRLAAARIGPTACRSRPLLMYERSV